MACAQPAHTSRCQ